MTKYTKKQLIEMAAMYVAQYPNESKIFATEDGNFFFSKNHCENHARAAKIEKFEIDLKSEVGSPKLAAKKLKEDSPVAEAKARVLELDLEKPASINYFEAKNLLKTLSLEPKSKSKEDVIASLKVFKIELKK